MSQCGASDTVAGLVISAVGDNPYVVLAAIFLTTVAFTEMLSNVAVATTMFYIGIGVASQLNVDPRPFIMAVTFAASLSFVSPIGYQTNLMVMGPGGYRPFDYIRAGVPLTLLVAAIAIVMIPQVWHF